MYWPFRRSRRVDRIKPDIESLRASQREITAQLRFLEALQGAAPTKTRSFKIDAATKQLAEIETRARKAFADLLTNWTARTEDYRRFQLDEGLNRPAKTPDRFTTLLVVQGSILVEGAGTAALAVADGKMDVLTGGIYGLTVAGLNVGAALAGGFFICRYLGYGLRAPEPDPLKTRIRRTAWIGFAGLTALLGLLNFAAARARATGSPEDIFNFETLGFWATFGNYYAIALLVLGALGAVLGIYKGWTGISDPYPGFGEARAAIEDAIDAEADALRERLLDQAERVFETADDALADALAEAEDAAANGEKHHGDLARLIPAHNHAVDAAVEALKAQCVRAQKRRRFIKNTPQTAPKPDTAPLNTLRIDPAVLPDALNAPDLDALRSAQTRLQAAFDHCVAAIEDAYADFQTSAPAYGLDD